MGSAASVDVINLDTIVDGFAKKKFDKNDCQRLAEKLGTKWNPELDKEFCSNFESDEEEEE